MNDEIQPTVDAAKVPERPYLREVPNDYEPGQTPVATAGVPELPYLDYHLRTDNQDQAMAASARKPEFSPRGLSEIVEAIRTLLDEAVEAGGDQTTIQHVQDVLNRLLLPETSLENIEAAYEVESQIVDKIIQMGSSFELPPAVIERVQHRSDFCKFLRKQIKDAGASGELPASFSYQIKTPRTRSELVQNLSQCSQINVQTHKFDENLTFIVAPDASANGKFQIMVYSEKDFILLDQRDNTPQYA